MLRSAQRPPALRQHGKRERLSCARVEASCSVGHGPLDATLSARRRSGFDCTARLVQLERCLPDPPLLHSKTCRGEPRPTDRLPAPANTRYSPHRLEASQLHAVAATAAPSHPALGDTKIIFEMADELQVRIPP